jgi:hypothetical protein
LTSIASCFFNDFFDDLSSQLVKKFFLGSLVMSFKKRPHQFNERVAFDKGLQLYEFKYMERLLSSLK